MIKKFFITVEETINLENVASDILGYIDDYMFDNYDIKDPDNEIDEYDELLRDIFRECLKAVGAGE